MDEMVTVSPMVKKSVTVSVPGSKSYTQRALVMAALAEGCSVIENALLAEDTMHLVEALRAMGAEVKTRGDNIIVIGMGGGPREPCEVIHLGNNGTAARFLLAVAAAGRGDFSFTGDERLCERPVGPLVEALESQGAEVLFGGRPGCLPLTIRGRGIKGGRVEIEGRQSSQFVSALLICAPYADEETEVVLRGRLSSRPYVAMTLETMKAFGVAPKIGEGWFRVPIRRGYRATKYTVEADYSSASYFLALAPLCGVTVRVENLRYPSLQGDGAFLDVLVALGCDVRRGPGGVEVTGGKMVGGTMVFDMGDMPDLVPTLAVVAACRRGKTVIHNVSHLRIKESDRLAALAGELLKTGIRVEERDDGLIIHGGRPRRAKIETYNDHRIAMSFAILGKAADGMVITNPRCVGKSFPSFWETLRGVA